MDDKLKRIYVPMTESGFYILFCLRQPQHGYGISQKVREMTGGALVISAGTMYGTLSKGTRYLEMAEGYVLKLALDKDNQVCGYQFLSLGKMMDAIKKGMSPNEAYEKNVGTYGRFKAEDGAVAWIDPRKQ